jgi:trigger factor
MAQATAEETKQRPNTVKIEDVGPSRKKISITIPAETVAEQLGNSLDTLTLEAELPGFRRGRAPRRLIEKKFGTAVRKEAKNQLVASAYSQAIEEHKLRVIGDPVSEGLEKIELEDGKPLSFEVEVEVLPEFELPSLEGIPVRKPVIEVKDDMIDAEIDKLRLHEGTLEERQAPEPGDYLTGHGVMKVGDEVIVDIMDAVVQVPPPEKQGKGMILGIVVDDFATQLKLPKPGETATIKAVGPENHENEKIRGKDLVITFEVARVDRIVRATDEHLLQRFGFETMDQLREALKGRIAQQVEIEQQTAMRQQVARYLLDNTEVDLPERVTAAQAERNLARQRMEMIYRGVPAQQIEEKIAELRAASSAAAVRELKLFFILDRAAEKLDIKVTEGELNARIAQIALANNMRPDKLRSQLIQQNQIGQVFQQVREHKTMDAIVAKAAITEMPAEEFNKVMREEAGAAASSGGGSAPKKSRSKKAEATAAEEGGAEEKPAAEKKTRSKKKSE